MAISPNGPQEFTETYPPHHLSLVQRRLLDSYYRELRIGIIHIGEVDMLSTRRCPHTGIVNFFYAADPHLAVGSVIKGDRSGYLWRCYAEPCEGGGSVADMKTAERRVVEFCRRAAAATSTPPFVDAA